MPRLLLFEPTFDIVEACTESIGMGTKDDGIVVGDDPVTAVTWNVGCPGAAFGQIKVVATEPQPQALRTGFF